MNPLPNHGLEWTRDGASCLHLGVLGPAPLTPNVGWHIGCAMPRFDGDCLMPMSAFDPKRILNFNCAGASGLIWRSRHGCGCSD